VTMSSTRIIIGGGFAGPTAASGATLAVEDAVILADELETGTLEDALTRFGRRRIDRARLVVDAAQAMVDLESEHRCAEEHEVQVRALAALAAPA
jgi:2-polyprenyl-6-methoxyphenol hydroxylase-like FAD-dependent oxidoreductase